MSSKKQNNFEIRQLNYKEEIMLLYQVWIQQYGMIPFRTEINFKEFVKEARLQKRKRNYAEAARIYREISEAIAENMDNVDDSDGYYGECFTDALHDMCDCINKQTLTDTKKRRHISYLFENYIKNDPDYFEEHYVAGLKNICTSKKDLQYWKKLLAPYLPKKIPSQSEFTKYYYAQERVLMQAHILKNTGDPSLGKFLKLHYRNSDDVAVQYVKYLQNKHHVDTKKIIQECVKMYPRSSVLKRLRQIFNKSSA